MYSVSAGMMEYGEALALQERLAESRRKGRLRHDIVVWLQHDPVFTLGLRGGRENLLVTTDALERKNIGIVQTKRGGNITYHGPGQLVAYPIVDLERIRTGIAEYVWMLEEVMCRTSADFAVSAARRPANRGVWAGEKKLGSVGVAVRHGITFHGLALNVDLDLEPFRWIRPCGLVGTCMTSLREEGSTGVSVQKVQKRAASHLAEIFGRKIRPVSLAYIEKLLHEDRLEAV